MRPLPLLATGLAAGLCAALLPATLLPAAAPAYAEGETCLGRLATAVGTPGQPELVGTEGDDVVVTDGAGSVATLGGDDWVCVTDVPGAPGRTISVDTGEGDDALLVERVEWLGASRSSYVGGPGSDLLALWAGARLDLDLASGEMVTRRSGRDVRTTVGGFDSTFVVATDLALHGTRRADDLRFQACRATVRGLAGSDVIAQNTLGTTFPQRLRCHQRERSFRLLGGGGHDIVRGGSGPDLLVGGPGRDVVSGNSGRDRCSGEKLKACEVRLR
ncbi:Ca2+-binding RTX toxin-like protein [Nocardioides cavernae]|uniref:Ca2+-binding RTX toxin-like protein n=1 Tax=Nocardioides cavernae TaxID=1921566 RepID=A0A7Y9KP69_9ACTN|nr:calcium-binding protein [Nocardioides cavernae]NYE36401.1 Ca2+-binding RTX toxin-like protein [Nocardioides cavernae]